MDIPTIEVTEEEKYLWVLINSNLKFSDQVASAFKNKNKSIGIVKTSIKYIDKEVIVLLYKGLFRHHLEYAITVGCPRTKRDLEHMERVQR